MIAQDSLLVRLVRLVDRLPQPPSPTQRGRGRPPVYSERLFLKALLVMLVRHIHTVSGLLTVLEQPTCEMQCLREAMLEEARWPTRRTWERRLHALPSTLPGQIGCLGRHLLAWLQPWGAGGKAVAVDSTVLRARGGVWHKKDREAGVVPHTSIDTQAHWTKSGWHGWVYGWKLHLMTTVADVWIPLAAELTAANAADNEVAPALLREMPAEVRYLLGDQHYHAPNVRELCACRGCWVLASQPGPYPHTDAGVGVRRLFHQLRSRAIENFNEQFKGIFDVHGSVPTKGLKPTQRFALGAIFLYQLTLWLRFEQGLDLRSGIKAFLKAA
jgi:DDE family transposase